MPGHRFACYRVFTFQNKLWGTYTNRFVIAYTVKTCYMIVKNQMRQSDVVLVVDENNENENNENHQLKNHL